ncbi:hypothetical protein, partial [Clostridioides difficile]|uniref:hypothetical protein n=1 Tax=Clostridioides difficile TaxID=1496 RepID=UPI00155A4E3F
KNDIILHRYLPTSAISVLYSSSLVFRKFSRPSSFSLIHAFANSGRKGPVLVDVPKDLFLAEMDFSGEDYDLCQIDDYMDYK